MSHTTISTYVCYLQSPSKHNPYLPALYLRGWIFALCLLSASATHALTIYRIGGEDLPQPTLEVPYSFVQLSWQEVDPARHGKSELLNIQAESIAPQTMDPNTNLTPLLEEFGGRIMVLEWNGWAQWRDDDIWIFDGDPETAYLGDGHYLRVAGYGPQNKYWLFDFGGRFFIDRVRFYPRERFQSTRFIGQFLIGINDGDPLKKGTRAYSAGWRGSDFDFDIVHSISENTQPLIELKLPQEPVQQLLFEAPENARGIWEIAEFEIYGTGSASQASYISNIIDLGAPAALGNLSWQGQKDAEARIDLSVRTGDDDDPNTYWRSTFRGNELSRFDAEGRELDLRSYNRLERGAQANISPDSQNWNFWGAPFDFDATSAPLPSDRLRRFIQIKADFHSTAQAKGQLNYLQFSVSVPPVASTALAEISPTRVAPQTPTLFTFKIKPHLAAKDLGFDRLAVDTPAQAQGIESVRIGGVEVDFEILRLDEKGFEVTLPDITQERTGELLEVDFRSEVFAFSTVFSGRIRNSTHPFEIAQPLTPGDADRGDESTGLRVELLDLQRDIIAGLTVSPAAFTPNGDFINDSTHIEYDLLYLIDAVAIEIAAYDLAGRKVAHIFSGQAHSGRFTKQWDGKGPTGQLLPPGLYLLRLTADTDQGKNHSQRLVSLVY